MTAKLHGAARTRVAADLRASYEQGHTIRSLAKLTSRSYAHTRDLLLEAGTTLRPRGNPRKRTT